MTSKTQEALRLMREQNMTAYQAAKAVGATATTIYAAWNKQKAEQAGVCPCCGQKLPDK